MAYEMVCPERIDLIHKNYRKLCNLMVDVDEWGQVTILNMLTRYARTQFVDPNHEVRDMDVQSCMFMYIVYVTRYMYMYRHNCQCTCTFAYCTCMSTLIFSHVHLCVHAQHRVKLLLDGGVSIFIICDQK